MACLITGPLPHGLPLGLHEEFGVPVASVENLIAQIFVAAGRIRDISGIFQNVRNSIQCRCQAFQTISGRNFKHPL
ncbi:hypothetical protein TNCV_622261 [Trichonephila clavipes]|nr:hypothetical protein TNCV_622261 [Trichonephila clavipes]